MIHQKQLKIRGIDLNDLRPIDKYCHVEVRDIKEQHHSQLIRGNDQFHEKKNPKHQEKNISSFEPQKSRSPSRVTTYIPPSKNFHQIQLERRTWQENENRKKEDLIYQQEMNGATFQPKISDYTNEKYKNRKRTPEQFYQDNIKWNQKKLVHLDRVKVLLGKQEVSYSYQPQLCQKQQIQKGFYQRLEDKQREKEQNKIQIKRSITPSFKPYLVAKSIDGYRQPERSRSPPLNNQAQTKQPHESFEFFENVRLRQQESRDDYSGIKQKEPSISGIEDNSSNDANTAIWKIIQRCEKDQANLQPLQPHKVVHKENSFIDYQELKSKVLLPYQNENMLHEPSFGNLYNQDEDQFQRNMKFIQEDFQSNQFSQYIDKSNVEADSSNNDIKKYLINDYDEFSNFSQKNDSLSRDRLGQPASTPEYTKQFTSLSTTEIPQQRSKRSQFTEKINSITENIQKLFQDQEDKRRIQQSKTLRQFESNSKTLRQFETNKINDQNFVL